MIPFTKGWFAKKLFLDSLNPANLLPRCSVVASLQETINLSLNKKQSCLSGAAFYHAPREAREITLIPSLRV